MEIAGHMLHLPYKIRIVQGHIVPVPIYCGGLIVGQFLVKTLGRHFSAA